MSHQERPLDHLRRLRLDLWIRASQGSLFWRSTEVLDWAFSWQPQVDDTFHKDSESRVAPGSCSAGAAGAGWHRSHHSEFKGAFGSLLLRIGLVVSLELYSHIYLKDLIRSELKRLNWRCVYQWSQNLRQLIKERYEWSTSSKSHHKIDFDEAALLSDYYLHSEQQPAS